MTRIADAMVEEARIDAVGDLLRKIDEPSGWHAKKEADFQRLLETIHRDGYTLFNSDCRTYGLQRKGQSALYRVPQGYHGVLRHFVTLSLQERAARLRVRKPTQKQMRAGRASGGSEMKRLSFSIVMPTYQRRDVVVDAVHAIGRIAYAGELEAIVVVDGSTDGTVEALSQIDAPFPLHIIQQANAGAARARNAGAAHAKGEILLFLDDDMICAPTIVERHAESYAAGADAVLGDLPLDPASPRNFLAGMVGEWAEKRSERLETGGQIKLFDLLTGQLSIRRSVFEAIGGFDGRFTRGGSFGNEDLDIGTRLLERYRVVFNRQAISHQRYVVTYRQNMRQWFQAGQADVEFARKHPAHARELFDEHGASELATQRYFMRIGRTPLLARGLAALATSAARHWWGKWARLDTLIEWFYFMARDVHYWSGVATRGGIPGRNPLLVLCYHAIAELTHDRILYDYGIPRAQFERQLDSLLGHGFHFIRPDELDKYLAGKSGLPRKAVLLTFDDCYEELLDIARDVLVPRSIPAIAFAVSGTPSNTNEWDQRNGCVTLRLLGDGALREITTHGVEVGCHSRTHREMPALTADELRLETRGAANELAAKGLRLPRYFAYPYGEVDGRSASAVRAAGFVAGFGLRAAPARPDDDPMTLPRVEILRSDRRLRFWLKTRLPFLNVLEDLRRYAREWKAVESN